MKTRAIISHIERMNNYQILTQRQRGKQSRRAAVRRNLWAEQCASWTWKERTKEIITSKCWREFLKEFPHHPWRIFAYVSAYASIRALENRRVFFVGTRVTGCTYIIHRQWRTVVFTSAGGEDTLPTIHCQIPCRRFDELL